MINQHLSKNGLCAAGASSGHFKKIDVLILIPVKLHLQMAFESALTFKHGLWFVLPDLGSHIFINSFSFLPLVYIFYIFRHVLMMQR